MRMIIQKYCLCLVQCDLYIVVRARGGSRKRPARLTAKLEKTTSLFYSKDLETSDFAFSQTCPCVSDLVNWCRNVIVKSAIIQKYTKTKWNKTTSLTIKPQFAMVQLFLELSRLLLRFETLYRISTMKFTWKSCVNCDSIVFFTQICVLASI